jgi:hypothetical protein
MQLTVQPLNGIEKQGKRFAVLTSWSQYPNTRGCNFHRLIGSQEDKAMGLNIGVNVKRQEEGYMSSGCNPKGTIAEIEAEFDAFLREKFPDEAFNPSVSLRDQEYTFDVYMGYRDSRLLHLAILEYVFDHFSDNYGIDMHVYHVP